MATAALRDRAEAGRILAERLRHYAGRDDVLVLGLPRGGVPVAFEVAERLRAPLDVFLVRKLGVPGHRELAMGAIASGGVRVLNEPLVRALGIPREWVEAIDAKEMRELERRERLYRGDRPPPDLTDRVVILVDDGLATGSTMAAAVQAARQDAPERVVVAVPVAPREVCEALRAEADDIVCLQTPPTFLSVGTWYSDFSQTTDEEVRELLERARRPPLPGPVQVLRRLTGAASDYDPLVELAAGKQYALIGEASHGTHEFYRARAELTRRLIAEAGYGAVAVEADWPDAYRVNQYVRGAGDDGSADEALGDFRRFPTWMWRNRDVAEFVDWLRQWNDARAPKAGFYGLDLYSLHTSMEAVVAYLNEVDPEAAQRARHRYACFDQFGRDPQVYAYEAGLAGAEPCEQHAVEQLIELLDMRAAKADGGGPIAEDGLFYAEQNARLVRNAERYYRAMYRGGIQSWNLRDRHMAETLDALTGHLERTQGPTKIVVWAHNSHLGDARATELGQAGELNVGQLVRERHGADDTLVGCSTYTGTVTAASDWGGPAQTMRVRPALRESWEEFFHEMDAPNLLLGTGGLEERRLERAIGVVYQPETERISHYFHARLARQFDAILHIDETSALEPLETTGEWRRGELPETYPWGV
jgi:erythromycin esterase-like protein/pyrimidine operon attenuation protein/uracil phosphoribosyltransferase